jgi:hypothetical protein
MLKWAKSMKIKVYQRGIYKNGTWILMTKSNNFLIGIGIGLVFFLLANLLAAHLLSDCGLPGVLGTDSCADDIARIGFPLIFFEEGGFAYRSYFNLPYFLLDLFISLDLALFSGFMTHWWIPRNSKGE